MNIIALDLGAKLGWARSDGEGGTYKLEPVKGTALGTRLLRLEKFLTQEFATVDVIAYEEVRNHSATIAAHAYGAYEGIMQKCAMAAGIPFLPLGVKTIKKYATGNGNAEKEEMIAAAVAKGWAPVDDNHADALWILDMALGYMRTGKTVTQIVAEMKQDQKEKRAKKKAAKKKKAIK